MDIILSFDTEDFLTPAAWDAQKWWADELSDRGIRASFQMVAELVRVLQREGRQDVIDALSRHEIGNHTNYHSVPPTHPQAVQHLSLADGIAWVIRHEAESFATLEAAFGRVPVTYCCPGDSWTPATLIAMAARGVKVFCDARTPNGSNRPYWYCGLLCSSYNRAFEECFVGNGLTVDELIGAVDAELDSMTPGEVYTLYSHPTRLATTAFWDTIFFNAQKPPQDQWHPAPLYSDADLAENKARARQILDHLQRRGDVRFIDHATLYAERAETRRDLSTLLAERGLAPGQEGRLPLLDLRDPGRLDDAYFDSLTYGWGPLPDDLDSSLLFEQARGLAWTAMSAELRRTTA